MTYLQLEALLEELCISQSSFCKETGISRQILTNAKSRGGHFSAATENKMKEFFENIGIWKYKDYIFDMDSINRNSNSDDKIDISYTAYEMAKQFDSLDPEHQRMIIEMIAFYKSKKQDN